MFTGIVEEMGEVVLVESAPFGLRYAVRFSPSFLEGARLGGSIALDGACQTIVELEGTEVVFHAIYETLEKTTLSGIQLGSRLNAERPVRLGEEIGGHLLTGHILGKAKLIERAGEKVTFEADPKCLPYLFTKGYIALDGVSLTLGEIEREERHFCVHLIPETLRRTTLGFKQIGESVNVEVDFLTQAAVETTLAINRVVVA